MKYYLLSLKWTNAKDLLFTFWRANASGYTFLKGYAGIYGDAESKIHCDKGRQGTDPTTVRIDKELADGLFVPVMYEGRVFQGLPVNEFTLQELGLKLEDLKKEHPSSFEGVEMVLNDAGDRPNPITTRNNLDFLIAEENPYDMNSGFQLCRVGTCEAQYRTTEDAIEILTIYNTTPGNGHLGDFFEWFEYAAKETGKKLRILELWNERFEQHLIGKRDFRPVTLEGDYLVLEKDFAPVVHTEPGKDIQAPKNLTK